MNIGNTVVVMNRKTLIKFDKYKRAHSDLSIDDCLKAFNQNAINGIETDSEGKPTPKTIYECKLTDCEKCSYFVNNCEVCEHLIALRGAKL